MYAHFYTLFRRNCVDFVVIIMFKSFYLFFTHYIYWILRIVHLIVYVLEILDQDTNICQNMSFKGNESLQIHPNVLLSDHTF